MSAYPIFFQLEGKLVLVVGDGPVAREKMARVVEAGARVRQVAPEINHAFRDEDLDGAWLAIAAATPEVNRAVRAAADARRVFVIAVDDVESCSAYGAARIDRGGLTVAISSDGRAPALVALLRRAIESLLPDEIETWREIAERERAAHRAAGVPVESRRPLLLRALNRLYAGDSKGGSLGSPSLPHVGVAKRRARRGELEGRTPLEQDKSCLEEASPVVQPHVGVAKRRARRGELEGRTPLEQDQTGLEEASRSSQPHAGGAKPRGANALDQEDAT